MNCNPKMGGAIEEVLSDLGWNDGFRIPIANAENKQLEEEIERKTRQRASLKAQLENANDRIKDIRKHATDVRQEHSQNQRLLAAHAAQVETENHMYRLAQSDESKLNQDMKQREKELRETNEKMSGLQTNVNKLMKKLENTKRNIKLDKDRLLSWEEKLNKKEEKNIVIEQFVKSDEKMFKKIELERQTLSEKAEVYRQAIIRAVGDVHELELSLERTARQYSQAVKDRRQLMNQWSQSVHVLKQRDKSIYDALQEISMLREIAKERMDSYQENERFLAIQESENKELEDGIKVLEKELAMHRDEKQKLSDMVDSYALELLVQQKQLQELARRTQDIRTNCKRKKSEVEGKKSKLEDTKKRVEDLRETLKSIDGQKMNTEQRVMQLQDMLEKEEKRKASISKEIRRQQDLILRGNARLSDLKGEHMVLALQQQQEAKRAELMQQEKIRDEKLIRERKEFVYKTDIELQKCEMRLQTLLGHERDKDELEAKLKRTKQLQLGLAERNEIVKTLQVQLSQVENEIRRISNSITSNAEELNRMKGRQQELFVMIEGGEKQLRVAQSNYEDRKVDENILELKLKEASKVVLKVDDKLYDLEKYALQMEAAMQERRSDIKVQKEHMNLQKRIAETDCSELRAMITERKSRVQQLMARYEIQVAALGTNPEDGSPLNAAYLQIQSAQERYLLQERGDHLDRTIHKAEQEIRSMENTLRLVNACNYKYKSSLSLVDDDGPEKAEQRRLDEELYDVLEILKQKKFVLEKAKDDCQRMEENCEQLEKDIDRVKEEKENKKQSVSSLEQQIMEQQEKISRADKNMKKVLRDIKNKCICTSDDTILVHERDIAVRELQEQNTLALQRIAEFTIRHLEAEAYVKKLLNDRHINLPCTYYLRQQATPLSSSRCEGSNSTCTTKTTSRLSLLQQQALSSRESAGSMVLLQPDFFSSPKATKYSVQPMQKRVVKKK